MQITPTTPKDRSALIRAGFVHATGLMEYGNMGRRIGCDLAPGELGTFTSSFSDDADEDEDVGEDLSNPPVHLLITTGGECWVSCMDRETFESECIQNIVRRFCPNGTPTLPRAAPGDNRHGELNWTEILRRVADPDWMPAEQFA